MERGHPFAREIGVEIEACLRKVIKRGPGGTASPRRLPTCAVVSFQWVYLLSACENASNANLRSGFSQNSQLVDDGAHHTLQGELIPIRIV